MDLSTRLSSEKKSQEEKEKELRQKGEVIEEMRDQVNGEHAALCSPVGKREHSWSNTTDSASVRHRFKSLNMLSASALAPADLLQGVKTLEAAKKSVDSELAELKGIYEKTCADLEGVRSSLVTRKRELEAQTRETEFFRGRCAELEADNAKKAEKIDADMKTIEASASTQTTAPSSRRAVGSTEQAPPTASMLATCRRSCGRGCGCRRQTGARWSRC